MRKLLLTVLFFCGVSLLTFAQQKVVTGTVISGDDNQPVIGATVQIKGTTIGVTTDIDGNYSITVEEGQTLIFRFAGLRTKEFEVGSSNTIDVVLQVDVLNLDEVVVVAYGTQKKEAKTGSVGVVDSESLQDLPETSIDKMLAGKVAGVVISQTSGQPGSATEVRIRGLSSINTSQEPLYVIDGVPVMQGDQSYYTNTGNALAALNPNDIASISILKDAAAASVYGSRAANGVILITTKTGTKGKSKISFRTSGGFDQLANDNGFRIMTPEEYLQFARDAVTNAGFDPDDADPSNATYYYPESLLDGEVTDWYEALTRQGKMYKAELTVEGGSEKTTSYFSGAYEKNEGIVYGVDYEKFQIRTNVDHQISDKLKAGTRINAAHTISNDIAMQAMYYVNPLFACVMIDPFTPLYNEDGSFNLSLPTNANSNPRATAVYDEQVERQNRFNGSFYLNWEIIDGLTARTTNSYELTDGSGRRYWDPRANYGETLGYLQSTRTQYTQMTTSNTLNYTKLFGPHYVQAIAGEEATKYSYNRYTIISPDVDPNIPFPNTSVAGDDEGQYNETAYSLLSYFGILYYNFDERYYLQASLRTDGSSRFGEDTKWGTFYSVGLSWNLHNESFLETVSMVNQLKLRGSYGVSGNFNIGNYDQYGTYGAAEYNGYNGMIPTRLANPDLAWEMNRELNAGIDFALFDRVSGSLDVYTRDTEDMLLDYPLSWTTGFNSIKQNVGSVNNRGWEFLINGSVVKNSQISWDLGFNIAHNKSEILDIGKDDKVQSAGSNRIFHVVGESLYSYYLYDWAGVNPANGDALWWTDDGEGGRGELTNEYAKARRFVAGTPEPKYTGGFNSALGWNGFTLDLNFEFKAGHQVLIEENRYANSDGYNLPSNHYYTNLDYWKEPGDITRNPKPIYNNPTSSAGYRSTRWMQDGDYLRIKSITLSYNLPQSITSKAKMQNLRVYASAINPYTFHDVDFWDPERGVTGAGYGIYPLTKKFIIGLDVAF